MMMASFGNCTVYAVLEELYIKYCSRNLQQTFSANTRLITIYLQKVLANQLYYLSLHYPSIMCLTALEKWLLYKTKE